jgi:hypothetical protein
MLTRERNMECIFTNGFSRQQVNLYMNGIMRLPVLRQPLPARGMRHVSAKPLETIPGKHAAYFSQSPGLP